MHEQRTHASVTVDMQQGPDAAPLAIKTAAFRLVQESLRNAVQHGQTAEQQVLVERSDCGVRIQVVDRGRGFDAAQFNSWSEHLGLIGMRERVESLGGSFVIHSSPGCGTTIEAGLVW